MGPTEDAFGDEIVAKLNLTTTGSSHANWVPLLNASYSAKNVTQLFNLRVMSNYTNSDVNYTEVGLRFDAVNANSGSGMRLETEAPDVETYCLYGVGVDTAKTVNIVGEPNAKRRTSSADAYKLHYTITHGDGDGTVNVESLSQCKKWSVPERGGAESKVHYHVLPGVNHRAMVTGEKAQRKVVDIVTSINRPVRPTRS